MTQSAWRQHMATLESDVAEQPFPTEEYRDRLGRVQSTLQDRELDALIVTTPENIYYLTGYDTTGLYSFQCLVVPAGGEPQFVVREIEGPNVELRSWVTGRKEYGDDYGADTAVETTAGVAAAADLLSEMGLDTATVGFEHDSWFLTVRQLETLRSSVSAELVGCAGIVEAERRVKSDRELSMIREAADIVERAVQSGIEMVGEGVVENDIAGETYSRAVSAGGDQETRVYLTSGTRSALAHSRWKRRTLEKGDLVNFEVGACVNRYYASLWRTVHVGGDLPETVQRAEKAVTGGLEAALETMAPGVTGGAVDAACRAIVEDAGFGVNFPHRTGYSLGIGYPPGWGEGHLVSLGPGDDTPLEPNMTFHMPVILFLPDYGAVGCSVTSRVTEDGVEVLADLDRRVATT